MLLCVVYLKPRLCELAGFDNGSESKKITHVKLQNKNCLNVHPNPSSSQFVRQETILKCLTYYVEI